MIWLTLTAVFVGVLLFTYACVGIVLMAEWFMGEKSEKPSAKPPAHRT